MTSFKSLALILCLQVLLAAISIPVSHSSRTILPKNENLIEKTCKKTPNYNVCVQSLKAYPQSSGADVTGLAQIMVKVITARANDALNKIHQLQRVSHEPKQKRALSYCGEVYTTVVEADVPQATQALQFGDPKFAEDGANDAAVEANACERGFSGKSPLIKQNNAMRDVAAVTAAIVRLLL